MLSKKKKEIIFFFLLLKIEKALYRYLLGQAGKFIIRHILFWMLLSFILSISELLIMKPPCIFTYYNATSYSRKILCGFQKSIKRINYTYLFISQGIGPSRFIVLPYPKINIDSTWTDFLMEKFCLVLYCCFFPCYSM